MCLALKIFFKVIKIYPRLFSKALIKHDVVESLWMRV